MKDFLQEDQPARLDEIIDGADMASN